MKTPSDPHTFFIANLNKSKQTTSNIDAIDLLFNGHFPIDEFVLLIHKNKLD